MPSEYNKNSGFHHPVRVSFPNWVSSRTSRPARQIAPFLHAGSTADALDKIGRILSGLSGIEVVSRDENGLRAECRSRVFGFVDDLEFVAASEPNTLHVQSSARTGYWDMGVNRRRVEKIRRIFDQVMDKTDSTANGEAASP